jgi:SNF2 family DNA or RNA helicase
MLIRRAEREARHTALVSLAGGTTGYTGLEKIGQTLAPVMIRRRKSVVLRQLPSRTDQNLLVPMTEMQMVFTRKTPTWWRESSSAGARRGSCRTRTSGG